MGCTTSLKVNPSAKKISVHTRKPTMPPQTLKAPVQPVAKDDPRIPLTCRQVYLLQKSWKAIARDMVGTGVTMFVRLFEYNKSVMQHFKYLNKDSSSNELRNNKTLENHARGVMLTVDEAIMSMHDVDAVLDALAYIATTHLSHMNTDPAFFLLMREPFLMAVKETLGDRYSAHIAEIYRKTIIFILESLVTAFEKGRQLAATRQLQ